MFRTWITTRNEANGASVTIEVNALYLLTLDESERGFLLATAWLRSVQETESKAAHRTAGEK